MSHVDDPYKNVIGWVYPLVQYWCWANVDPCPSCVKGWLRDLGFKDFAGSAVVHLLGGTCALVACAMVGPRQGFFMCTF